MSNITFMALGGFGNVTQNMYVYGYEDELLVVDCGIGFPDSYMPGVDILIPDISYLTNELEKGKKLVGIAITHGHDDHIAALPYIVPHLPEVPIYASPLSAAFAEQRMVDGGVSRKVTVVSNTEPQQIGSHFKLQWIPVTHSVPDTRHIAIHTPEGVIYHGSDFKLDPTPVDNVPTDLETIAKFKTENVICMMIDCLRSENDNRVPSESTVGPQLLATMQNTKGKHIVTLMSSHIHRIQQTIWAARKCHRKIVLIGRSVEQNVEIATRLGHLDLQPIDVVDKKNMQGHKDSELCVIVAGSQGQEGSSLVRAVFGDHPILKISPDDVVVFSSDVIPGNETNFYGAIDELARSGISVMYPDVLPNLHQSGHASAPEQQEMLALVHPKLVLPIGGNDRHRARFSKVVAQEIGYSVEDILLPESGQLLSFDGSGNHQVIDHIALRPQIVDGLGVGDVGPTVLSDRRALGQAGIVVVAIPRRGNDFDLKNITVVSRGFVFMKEAEEVVSFISQTTAETVSAATQQQGKNKLDEEQLKRNIERKLSRKLYKVIQREPMIVAVFINK